jgi:hypothetical protein
MKSPSPGPNSTKPTMERDQGSIRGSGINKGMQKADIPQIKAVNTYGRPTQKQSL